MGGYTFEVGTGVIFAAFLANLSPAGIELNAQISLNKDGAHFEIEFLFILVSSHLEFVLDLVVVEKDCLFFLHG